MHGSLIFISRVNKQITPPPRLKIKVILFISFLLLSKFTLFIWWEFLRENWDVIFLKQTNECATIHRNSSVTKSTKIFSSVHFNYTQEKCYICLTKPNKVTKAFWHPFLVIVFYLALSLNKHSIVYTKISKGYTFKKFFRRTFIAFISVD